MHHQPALPRNLPHLTPARLVGLKFGRNPFGGIRVALVGYCPPAGKIVEFYVEVLLSELG